MQLPIQIPTELVFIFFDYTYEACNSYINKILRTFYAKTPKMFPYFQPQPKKKTSVVK